MKVVLVDDEQLAIDVLEILLTKIEDVEIVGKYTDPILALQEIGELNADVVFLEMEMGELHGLQFAERLTEILPQLNIVFVSAHSQFALEAFEVYAVDYLLKPVNRQRLNKTIGKIRSRQPSKASEICDYLVAHTMGSFHLLDANNTEVKWRTRKVKELFVYLWHHSPNPVHRSKILDDLWNEHPEDRATTLMHTTLYQLRKTIRGIGLSNPVKLANEHYSINVSVKSDLTEIERIIQSTDKTPVMIQNLIDLYRGNYLEGEVYSWAFSKQHKLKSAYLDYLERYTRKELRNKDQLYLIERCLEKMVELDAYNESFVYLLINFYGVTKNLSKMIEVMEKFRKIWVEELGIDLPDHIFDVYNKHIIHS